MGRTLLNLPVLHERRVGRHRRKETGPRALAQRITAAWATRPARTILSASLLISITLPFAGTAPSTAEAAPSTISPNLATVAMDEQPPTDPADGDPAAAPTIPSDGLIHLSLVPGDNEVRFIMRLRTLGQPTRPAGCATRAVTGQIVLTQDAAVVSDMSKMVVEP